MYSQVVGAVCCVGLVTPHRVHCPVTTFEWLINLMSVQGLVQTHQTRHALIHEALG